MKKISYFLVFICLIPFTTVTGQSGTFTRVFYDSWLNAQGYGIAATTNGVYVIAGVRDNRAMLAGVNDNGDLLWMKQCPEEFSRFQCVTTAHNGAVVAAGYISGPVSGDIWLYLMKVAANGDTIFSRVIETGAATYVQSIQQTPDHGFILAGWQELDVSPYNTLFVAKTDSAGHVSWFRQYHSFYPSFGYSARPATGGGYLVAGRAPGSTPFQESALFMKLSESGDVTWRKDVQTGTGSHMSCNDVAETPDGLLLLVSSSNNDWYLVRTDTTGNFQGAVSSYQFAVNYEFGYPRPKLRAISGNRFVFLTPSWGYDDQLLVVDQTGTQLYRYVVHIITADIALRPDQGFMILGNGPIMGVMMANTTNPQIGIMATDSTGVTSSCSEPMMLTWENKQLITTDYPLISYIVAPTEVSPPVLESTTLAYWDGCVAVTGDVGKEKDPVINILVSPNPSAGIFTLSLTGVGSVSGSIEIFDLNGKRVYFSMDGFSKVHDIDISHCQAGLYFIKIMTETGVFHQKAVISSH